MSIIQLLSGIAFGALFYFRFVRPIRMRIKEIEEFRSLCNGEGDLA